MKQLEYKILKAPTTSELTDLVNEYLNNKTDSPHIIWQVQGGLIIDEESIPDVYAQTMVLIDK